MLNGLLREYKNNLIWWLERVSYIEGISKNRNGSIWLWSRIGLIAGGSTMLIAYMNGWKDGGDTYNMYEGLNSVGGYAYLSVEL